jgi:tetratricopeptide (TPR) repeat protein
MVNSLHQLPPPPRDFTGRERELGELTSQIERGGVTISGLRGLGGIGKTALALELARRLAPRYPDAQLYLDLKGAGKNPLSVADAFSHVIRAYDPMAKLPEGEAELQSRYLSVLHGQRALLLMDNAAGREQVEHLIPPDGCVLLVTSRQHFTLPGLFALDLETLPPEDARRLLLMIARRIGDYADEIAHLCGHLPLALRLAASALAERPNFSPSDYVRRLSDAKTRLSFVEASLTLSYELLSHELQRLWRSLAVFPDTFDTTAAAAVWALDTDAALDALGELVRYSLLEWDDDIRRYRLHDLVRLFANSRLTDDERSESEMRHAKYYLDVLRAANELHLQGGDDLKRGIALFDLEWPNIQVGQRWTESRSCGDDAAATLCSHYAEDGVFLLDLRQHPRERLNWLEAARSAARQIGDHSAEERHLGNLGGVYGYLGDFVRAREIFEERLDFAQKRGDEQGKAASLANLGWISVRLGETRRAIDFYEKALAISRSAGNRFDEAFVLHNLGNAYQDLGKIDQALKLYDQALTIFREHNYRKGEGAVLGDIGNSYRARGEMRRAIEYFEQQLVITREIGDRRGEANGLFNSALALNVLGARDKAIVYAEAALKIFERLEAPHAKTIRATLARWRGEATEGE